jgi:hypothetical protein
LKRRRSVFGEKEKKHEKTTTTGVGKIEETEHGQIALPCVAPHIAGNCPLPGLGLYITYVSKLGNGGPGH